MSVFKNQLVRFLEISQLLQTSLSQPRLAPVHHQEIWAEKG